MRSCRIQVSLQGFEWSIYNKTDAYDSIISQMNLNNSTPPSRVPTHDTVRDGDQNTLPHPIYPPSLLRVFSIGTPRHVQRFFSWAKQEMPSMDPKDLLPVGIEVYKGAIVCGNASTPNLLVAEFQQAEGTYGIVQVRRSQISFTSTHTLSVTVKVRPL